MKNSSIKPTSCAKAEKTDSLQEMFADSILKELPGRSSWAANLLVPVLRMRNGYPTMDPNDVDFNRICQILSDVCKHLDLKALSLHSP